MTTTSDTLHHDFVTAKSTAVRNLVQRLSRGGMAARLQGVPWGEDLATPLVYLHTWHWLREQVPAPWRSEVLAFSKNQAFAPLVEVCGTKP